MSNRVRGRKRRAEAVLGATAGWAQSKDALEDAQQQTHDNLITLMGDQRVGRVVWRVFDGVHARRVVADMSARTADLAPLAGYTAGFPSLAGYYMEIDRLLREYGGFLVIATAMAR
jgi:hypothetical protein